MISVRSSNYFDILRAAESQAPKGARTDDQHQVVRVAVVDAYDAHGAAPVAKSALPSNPALGRVVNIVV